MISKRKGFARFVRKIEGRGVGGTVKYFELPKKIENMNRFKELCRTAPRTPENLNRLQRSNLMYSFTWCTSELSDWSRAHGGGVLTEEQCAALESWFEQVC